MLVVLALVTLWRGHASWYGAGYISGTPAAVYAFVCLAFAACPFLCAFSTIRAASFRATRGNLTVEATITLTELCDARVCGRSFAPFRMTAISAPDLPG